MWRGANGAATFHPNRKVTRVANNVREHSQALLHKTLIAGKGFRGPWTWDATARRARLVSLHQTLTRAAVPLWKPEQAEGEQSAREVTFSYPSG